MSVEMNGICKRLYRELLQFHPETELQFAIEFRLQIDTAWAWYYISRLFFYTPQTVKLPSLFLSVKYWCHQVTGSPVLIRSRYHCIVTTPCQFCQRCADAQMSVRWLFAIPKTPADWSAIEMIADQSPVRRFVIYGIWQKKWLRDWAEHNMKTQRK